MDLTTTLRSILRRWRQRPVLPGLAVSILVIGIGAGAAVLSVATASLWRPLPYPDEDALVVIESEFPTMKLRSMGLSGPEASELAGFVTALEASGFGYTSTVAVGAGDVPGQGTAANVSAGVLQSLRPAPVLGRMFTEADDLPGGPAVVVLGEAFWRRVLGADATVVGRAVQVDGRLVDVIGIVPARVDFVGRAVDLWLPLQYDARSPAANRANHAFTVVGRIAAGHDLNAARADLERAVAGWVAATGQFHSPAPRMHPLTMAAFVDTVRGPLRPATYLLVAAVCLVFVIATANAATLLVADADARRSELAVRAALGATTTNLWGLHVAEAGLLASIAATGAVAAGVILSRTMVAAAPPTLTASHVDLPLWTIAAFAAGLALVAAIAASAAPLLRVKAPSLAGELTADNRSGTASRERHRVRRVLVRLELALAVALVAGAALMLESFVRLLNVDLGFRTSGVLRAFVNLPAARYSDRRATDLFYDRVDELVRAEPGVASVAFINGLPPERRPNNSSFVADGQAVDMHTGVPPLEFVQFGSPSMFDALGVPLLQGRTFSATDTQNAAPVAVINERAARAFFQNSNPIGRRMRAMFPGRPWMTIIGVVANMRQNGLTRPAGTELYVPLAQAENASNGNLRNLHVVIRTTGGAPESIADALRKAVASADSTAALSNIEAMDVTVARTIAAPRFLTWVVGSFAAIALLLAAVGVYGVVSHSVASRTREIGVRRSLGASAPAIGRLIAHDIGRLVVGGLALGVLAAVYGSRALAPFAFATAADSPGRIAAVAALLGLAAFAAGAVPLVRALRIDPASALRQ